VPELSSNLRGGSPGVFLQFRDYRGVQLIKHPSSSSENQYSCESIVMPAQPLEFWWTNTANDDIT
jgi:hypothetical protein